MSLFHRTYRYRHKLLNWRAWLSLLLLSLLAACATPRLSQDRADAFNRSGRFSITVTELSGHIEAVQGGFSWSDTGSFLRLDLTNPMGSTLARVSVNRQGAILQRSDGSQEVASHPDALVEQVVGSPIPVAGLRAWLQGRLAPAEVGLTDAHTVSHDGNHRLATFTQQGWQVQLSRYDILGPTLLRLSRTDAGHRIQVRLAISPQEP